MEGSVWAEADRDSDGDMDGGERLRPWWGAVLQHGNGREKRGERWRSSPRIQRARGRGRGCPGAPESTASTHGGRRRGWRRRWLHGMPRLAWLDEEVEGVAAELGGSTEGRGDGGERVGGELRRRQRFGRGERERSRGGGRARESGRGPGRRVATFQGVQGDEREKQEVAGRVAATNCGAGTQLLGRGGGRRQRRRQAGLLLGCCWAAQ